MVRPTALKSKSKAHAEMEAKQIHFHMQVIKRSEGRNAVACASYRHAFAMYDERTGVKFDFSKSNEEHIGFSKVLAPVGTPLPLLESESLWQSVEFAEKRKDAQLCREFDAGLPVELTKQQQIDLMIDFCQTSFVVEGMVCDMAMHDKKGNPHFHTMITMRDIDPDAEYGFGKKNRKWNKKDLVDIWRHNYEECINKHLAMASIDRKYSCETLEAQGIDRIPQIHKGSAAVAIAEGGGESWRVEKNDNIIDFNQTSSKLKARKAAAAKALAQEKEHAKIEKAHALAIEIEAERISATYHYNKLIHGLDKKMDLRETWRAWKPVEQVHIPEWRQIGLGLGKTITGIIGSIRKLTTEYFDIYGRDVIQDAAGIDGDSLSSSGASATADDNVEINEP